MSKIVKLSKRAVVLSTLLVLGSLTVLPVAYANNVLGQPDPVKYCADHGWHYSYYNVCLESQTDQARPSLEAVYHVLPDNNGLCSEEYPGSKHQEHPVGCVRASATSDKKSRLQTLIRRTNLSPCLLSRVELQLVLRVLPYLFWN